MSNRFGKWFGRSPSGVHSFTFSRDMTPEEIEETSRAMDEAFAQMDDVFKVAFPDRKSRFEARRAETVKLGSVHKSGGRAAICPNDTGV